MTRAVRPLVVGFFAAALLVAAGTGSAGDVGELRDRIRSAEAQEADLAGQILAQSDRIAAVQGQIGVLGAEVAELERRLAASRDRLDALQLRLGEQTRALERLGTELATANRRLEERLVELYTSDQPELVEVLLGAESLGGLIDQVAFYDDLLEQDDELVGEVRAGRSRVGAVRAETQRLAEAQRRATARLAAQAGARRAAYDRLVAERDRLTALRDSRQRTLASVEVRREEWEGEAAALQAQSAQVAAAAQAAPVPASAPDVTAPAATSSGWLWPVRGSVVSPYGQRWGRLHAGVDIAAPAGTPVVASASGTVTYSGSMSGYGNIVVVQHANGIATAYAHNTENLVGVGQAVAQGETIATVGCTGSCFGDHVHFEVRVDGSPVDPMGYI